MRIFRYNWEFRTVYYDCSNICFWSSGFENYRRCKDCGLQESKNPGNDNSYWKLNKDKDIFKE